MAAISEKPLNGKVAIVTGASRGIGRAIAEKLADAGATVYAVARDARRLDEIAQARPAVIPSPLDVTDERGVEELVRRIGREANRLDILVNNAGIGVFGPVEETAYEDFLRVFQVNAGGTFLFSRAALRLMKARRSGDIINIASVVAHKGYPNQCAYGTSKHAVLGLTKALAAEAHPYGVRVRSICPGGVDTDLIRAARPDLDPGELMRPEEIAEIVYFLLVHSTHAVIDDVNVRRASSEPWF